MKEHQEQIQLEETTAAVSNKEFEQIYRQTFEGSTRDVRCMTLHTPKIARCRMHYMFGMSPFPPWLPCPMTVHPWEADPLLGLPVDELWGLKRDLEQVPPPT